MRTFLIALLLVTGATVVMPTASAITCFGMPPSVDDVQECAEDVIIFVTKTACEVAGNGEDCD